MSGEAKSKTCTWSDIHVAAQCGYAWADPDQGVQIPPPGNSQATIGFLRNAGTDSLLEGDSYGRSSMKYVDV